MISNPTSDSSMNHIQIVQEGTSLFLSAIDENGRGLIHHPLHRIFLQSTLGGEEQEDSFSWVPIPEAQQINILLRLITHFDRYSIPLELDGNCKNLLELKKKDEDAFKVLLTRGAGLKKHASVEARENVSSQLTPDFKRQLKDFQLDAVNHLLTLGNGANFSVPGSGKTSVALAYYYILWKQDVIDGVFIIGPASCFEPWEHEYSECFKERPQAIRIAGVSKERRKELYALSNRYDIILTTYHSAARDKTQIIETLKKKRYLLILDESHYIKRPQGGKIADTVLDVSKHAKYRIILTGTPMPNSLDDLWSQFAFLWGEISPLGSVMKYLRSVRSNSKDTSLESVRKKIAPLFWRTTKKQLNLPPVKFQSIECPLSPLQLRIYRGIVAKFLSELREAPQDKDALREWRKARAIRLLQVASNPTLLRQKSKEFSLPPMELEDLPLRQGIEYYAKYEIPSKFDAVMRLSNELCIAGNKIIIWSSFIHNLTMLSKLLSKYQPVAIHGSVPVTSNDDDDFSREARIHQFKTDPNCKIMLANPAACAESISLHDVCHHAIYLDRTFNCAHYLQSLDRIHRIGLPEDQVTSYYLLSSENTIDEIVNARLLEKIGNMRSILEDDLPGALPDYWINPLGDDESTDLELVEKHISEFADQ